MDYFTLEKSAVCLNLLLTGAQIRSCGQLGHRILGLHVKGEKTLAIDTTLLLDLNEPGSGLYLSDQHFSSDCHTILARSFRNKLAGAYIVGLTMPFADRAVVIDLKMAEWPNPRQLWIEFTGSRSNIILIDSVTRVIQECLSKHPDDQELHPLRMPGRLFEPAWNRLNKRGILPIDVLISDGITPPEPQQDPELTRWLMKNFVPMTPRVAQTISTVIQSSNFSDLHRIVREIANREFSDLNEPKAAFEYLERLAEEKKNLAGTSRQQDLGSKLNAEVTRSLKRIRRTIKAVKRDQEKLPDPQAQREIADSVAAQYHQLKSGMSSIEVPNIYHSENVLLSVTLNPKMDPSRNLEQLYKRANKALRAGPKIRDRLIELDIEEQALETMRRRIQSAESESDLTDVEQALKGAGFFSKRGKQKQHQPMLTRKPFLRFHSPEGYRILVGKNARENDLLSFREARPTDFWLHAHGFRGAHVIVRNPGKAIELPPAVQEFAAELAVYFSGARGEKAVPVFITFKKYVRKAAGNVPGLAVVSRHETIVVDSPGSIPDIDS